MPVENGVLQIRDLDFLPLIAAPAGEIHVEPLGLQGVSEDGADFVQRHLRAGKLGGLQYPQPLADAPPLLRGEHGPVHGVPVHQGDASAGALGGHDGDSGNGQRVNIPVDGFGGYMEELGKLSGRHTAMVDDVENHLHKTLNLHGGHSSRCKKRVPYPIGHVAVPLDFSFSTIHSFFSTEAPRSSQYTDRTPPACPPGPRESPRPIRPPPSCRRPWRPCRRPGSRRRARTPGAGPPGPGPPAGIWPGTSCPPPAPGRR